MDSPTVNKCFCLSIAELQDVDMANLTYKYIAKTTVCCKR